MLCPSCRSIAQGSSEYNITVLVDQKDSVRALRAVHGRFYLATLPLGVGLVGPGLIGKTFLAQIQNQMKVRSQYIYKGVPYFRRRCLPHSHPHVRGDEISRMSLESRRIARD